MLWTRQQVGASHALWVARAAPNLHQMLLFRVKFDVTHHPHREFFPPSLSPLSPPRKS